MLKLGFSLTDVRGMYAKDVEAYLEAHEEIVTPNRGKTYKVKKKSCAYSISLNLSSQAIRQGSRIPSVRGSAASDLSA
jgi:hypothetical protein